MTSMRRVEIRWHDASSDDEWLQRDDLDRFCEKPLTVVTSLGFLYHKCDSHIVLTAGVTEDGETFEHALKIPRSAVLKIRKLK